MNFSGRPPSTSWEWIPFADPPHSHVWVWFKPPYLPQGLVLRIPDETFRNSPHRDQLTTRKLLQAAEVDPSCVTTWNLYGIAYEGNSGTSPYFDQVIPEPLTGVDPNIHVCLNARYAQPMEHATSPAAAEEGNLAGIFEIMDAEWRASTQIESQLMIRRKQLYEMLTRLNALNRDLSHEERLLGDTQDKTDWQDARRWLRNVSAKISRYIKQYDIGETTSAGKRKWIEYTYQQFILPRQAFEGMQRAQREFESYRKTAQTLLNHMNTAYTNAAQDGERRAQQILNRIAAKVRTTRSKR